MKAVFGAIFLVFLISGCGKSGDSPELRKQLLKIPGYREAKVICGQCHQVPFPEQHVSAAWPAVVSRMENYIRANKRRMPTDQEREALLGYFQKTSN